MIKIAVLSGTNQANSYSLPIIKLRFEVFLRDGRGDPRRGRSRVGFLKRDRKPR